MFRKYGRKLSIQMGIVVVAVNICIMLFNYVFLYRIMEEILLVNYTKNSVEWFEQLRYNINDFYGIIDKMLLELSMSSDVEDLKNIDHMELANEYRLANSVLDSMADITMETEGVCAAGYYGQNGLVVEYFERDKQYRIYANRKDHDSGYLNLHKKANNNMKLQVTGGHTDEDLRFAYQDAPSYYISFYRSVVNKEGTVALHYDMDAFLDKFYVGKDEANENIYIMDEQNRIVAARDKSVIGEGRIFEGGERVEHGIYRHLLVREEEELQAVVYTLPFMDWKVVSEKSVVEVTKDSRYIRDLMVGIGIVCAGATFLLVIVVIALFLKPVNVLVTKMQRVGEGELGDVMDKIPENEIGSLVVQFNDMSEKLENLFRRIKEIEKEKREHEMRTLRAQINPHLIYNTLNTIKWMAIIKGEKNIAESISLLSAFLRPVFRDQKLLCSIDEELDYLNKYIAIMNLGSNNKYTLQTEVAEKCRACSIVRFSLQPIVENAIVHGFESMDSGLIVIRIAEDEQDVVIRVEDNGAGMEPGRLEEMQFILKENSEQSDRGVGIVNVNRRIRLQYGDGYGLCIDSSGHCGTVIVLRIPGEDSGE